MPLKLLKPTTLRQEWSDLADNIRICDNMLLGDDEFDQNEIDIAEEQLELRSDMEEMCQKLGILEEVMNLRYHVDCDCFYTRSHVGHPQHAEWLLET